MYEKTNILGYTRNTHVSYFEIGEYIDGSF